MAKIVNGPMQWDWQNRALRLSVGELARFSMESAGDEASGRWRAELGTHWHGVLREQTESEEAGWTFEQPVSGSLRQEGWSFHLQGRIDQFKPGPETLLREVKTVSAELPADPGDLRAAYPPHFHQAMLYAFLIGREGTFPATELVFLEIQSGTTQTVRLGDADLDALLGHVRDVARVLEERRGHFVKLRKIRVPPAFPTLREGQPEAGTALAKAVDSAGPVLFEAPTGFGKTGLVLEQVLHHLAAGRIERILVLTGKNTGHSAILDQLASVRKAIPGLAVHALRSRRDLQLGEEAGAGLSRGEILGRWRDSGLSARKLLDEGFLGVEDLHALGREHGIPPWAISRILLPYADIWIADYNYLFDPGVSQVLDSIPTYAPELTALVVDEAHNLPDRAAACRSHTLATGQIDAVFTEVQFARFPGNLPRLLDQLHAQVKRIKPADALDPPVEADLIGLLREIQPALRDSSFGEDELSPETLDWLWNVPALLADWDHPGLPFHTYSPARGVARIACLDAAEVIQPVLTAFRPCILMSATLRPWDAFSTSIGLQTADPRSPVLGESPWLEGRFRVLVDARVDTRYRERDRHLETTTRTIGESALCSSGCLAVFFPSYRYAEKVLERLAFLYPGLGCELQPRDLPLEEQVGFLESALQFDDVLFLVLGSRFSEGIDALGGRIRQAIVVSPAFPEVNGLQKAREALVSGGSAAAFRAVYQIPGMRKISQALGRLVRNPDHSAAVLLHGKRFIEPDLQDLLPAYLLPEDVIFTDADLEQKWLSRNLND